MTCEEFGSILQTFMSREPFRAFTVELHDGTRFEVDAPGSVAWRDGFAIFVGDGLSKLIYFDNTSVLRFV